MQVYEGKSLETGNECVVTGLGASVVLQMVSILETPSVHKVYFDNFFTGFALMKYLQDIDVRATGTVRFNRINKCPIANDKEMKKKDRGTYYYRFDVENEVLAVTWTDNSCVKLLTNHETIEPISQAIRWNRAERQYKQITQPKLITAYHKHLGGVDKMDWSVQKYRIKIRGKKWHFPLLTNAFDVALVNTHVLYCLANGAVPLLGFRRMVARTYLALSSKLSDPKKAGQKSFPKSLLQHVPFDIRESAEGHYIERSEMGKQRKCAICKKNVRKQCSKCNVELHVECFRKWHKN